MFKLFFIFWSILKLLQCQNIDYDVTDDNSHGVRISGNDQFAVYIVNRDGGFTLVDAPYTPLKRCSYWNTSTDLFVYSIDVIFNNDNTTANQLYTFVQIAEQTTTQNIYFSIITLNRSLCVNNVASSVNVLHTLIWSGKHQEYVLLKVAPSQKYAYAFADSFVLSFDIINNKIVELIDVSATVFWSLPIAVIPHAIDLTEQWGIIVGFVIVPQNVKISVPIAFLCQLQPLRLITYVVLFDDYAQTTATAIVYNFSNDMSVAINNARQMAIVGFGLSNSVILLNINVTDINPFQWTLNRTRIDGGPQSNVGFGRSVAWLDNTTVAIAVLTVNNRPWSQSEVWTFDVDKPFTIPLSVYPNNQQILKLSPPPQFIKIVSWSGHLYILTNMLRALLIPSRDPGYQPVWPINSDTFILTYGTAPCLAGTYKKDAGAGLCTVCPPQTKNLANEASAECRPCSVNSFCPLGSINDVSLNNYPSYLQTFSYPDSPDMNNYDDILVQNIFTIGRSSRCIVIAPLFWTLIAIALCFIVWIFMTIGKIRHCKLLNRHRDRAKKFLKQTDIVGDGERWIGGLLSFAIIILFGFTFWFAADYLRLYPLEESGAAHASCDDTMRNAMFDNSLQLPLSNADGTRWHIFDMLDEQPFTMTLDLVNTRANCLDITIQQNRPGVNYVLIPISSCIHQPDDVTISVTFPLPSHQLSIQLNITGASFVGGIRLCLRGPGLVDGVNTLQTLDTCQFLFTTNETLARTASLSVVLIKVVNQTKPLRIGDDALYSGRWAPTFAESILSDKLIYQQDGDYLRYITERTTFSITFSEQPFFLQNNQQPIVRVAELSFHTLLFCTLIIELFAMAFLLFKLVGMPLIRLFLRCCHRQKQKIKRDKTELSLPPYILSSRLQYFNNRRSSHLFRSFERKRQIQNKNEIAYISSYLSNDSIINMADL